MAPARHPFARLALTKRAHPRPPPGIVRVDDVIRELARSVPMYAQVAFVEEWILRAGRRS